MFCYKRCLERVRVCVVVVMLVMAHSQIIKTSFNKTKAINDEFNAINGKRSLHNADGLLYDNGLCARANDHADYLASVQILQHSTPFQYGYVGEALAYVSKPPNVAYFGGEATSQWYGQGVDYDYDTGKSTTTVNVDDFTSILWSSTTSICIAIKETYIGSGSFYVVVHLYPVPNIEGEFVNNVFRPV